MTGSQPSAEVLNAYVDGELSRAEEAEVARAAARDRAVAARIATLRELKAALVDMVPDREVRLPGGGRSPARTPAYAVAACLMFLVGAVAVHLFGQPAPSRAQWARALDAHHQAWSFTAGREAAILRVDAPSGMLPLDLTASRLNYVGQEHINVAGHWVLRTGYEGTRGCHLSLFVLPRRVELDRDVLGPSLHVRMWTISERNYVLMADGMAMTRFEQLARVIERALRTGRPFDAGTRRRLAQSRRTSPPCSA